MEVTLPGRLVSSTTLSLLDVGCSTTERSLIQEASQLFSEVRVEPLPAMTDNRRSAERQENDAADGRRVGRQLTALLLAHRLPRAPEDGPAGVTFQSRQDSHSRRSGPGCILSFAPLTAWAEGA